MADFLGLGDIFGEIFKDVYRFFQKLIFFIIHTLIKGVIDLFFASYRFGIMYLEKATRLFKR